MKRAVAIGALVVGAVAVCVGLFFALRPRPSRPEPGPQPRLVLRLIQTTEQDLRAAEAKLGFHLDPQSGRCILSEKEAGDALRFLGRGRFSVIGEAALPCSLGRAQEYSSGQQLTFTMELDEDDSTDTPRDGERVNAPAQWTKPVGFNAQAELSGPSREGVYAVDLRLQAVRHIGSTPRIGSKMKHPLFKTCRVNTTLYLRRGEAAVMVQRPYYAYEEAAASFGSKPSHGAVVIAFVALTSGR